ncbi:MAG: AraC family transcriptional regulator [Clostridia bacterium]|nr:AraC family transcriptional regulator [Clostridia bacterium]
MGYNDVEFIGLRNNSIYCRRQRFISKNQHWHAYYEIELVVEGEGKHIINGHNYHETEGDIFLMRLTDFHGFSMKRESEHWVVEIPPALMPDEIAQLLVLAEGDILTHLSPEDFNRAKELFFMIEECNDKNNSFYEMQKMHLMCSLVLFILEKVGNNLPEKCSRNNVQIREIIAFIQDNLFKNLSISDIASHFFISREYLSAFFKKNTGITLVSYIRKAKITYASKLVVTTDKKMIEIAEASGFNAISTFMRDFKKEFGISPTEMRQRYRENKLDGLFW